VLLAIGSFIASGVQYSLHVLIVPWYVPIFMTTAAVMIRPALWRWFASGSVTGYALTPAGWEILLRTPPA